MTHQPHDVFACTYENEFNNLNTGISLRDEWQVTNGEINIDLDKGVLSALLDLPPPNISDEFIDQFWDSCATPSLAPSYQLDEQLFPDCQLDEAQLTDLFEDPTNEVTITTTTSDVKMNDNVTINNTPSESTSNAYENLTIDEIENTLKRAYDQISLQYTDASITQRTMSVETQPPINLRPRYKSDGTRQIEKSRTKPMAIKLPNLKDVQLNPHQLFWLRLVLITSDQLHIHANILEYHSNSVHELNDRTVCVPLTLDDINEGTKKLSRLSIIKTKYGDYKSELIPYSLSAPVIESQDGEKEEISVKQAKDIFNQFNMKASRIAVQLLIKENDSWYFTNIACETDIMEEKTKTSTTKKRSSASIDSDEEEIVDKRPRISKSKSTKRKKRSN